jgi:hypothetical protein
VPEAVLRVEGRTRQSQLSVFPHPASQLPAASLPGGTHRLVVIDRWRATDVGSDVRERSSGLARRSLLFGTERYLGKFAGSFHA